MQPAMNENEKAKPVRDLLRDISTNSEPSRISPRGLINPKLMDRITFVAAILWLILMAATLIGMIWGSIDDGFGFRFVGSACVAMLAILGFRAINSQFD